MKVRVGDVVTLSSPLPYSEVDLEGPEGESLKLVRQPDSTLSAGPIPSPGAWLAHAEGQVVPSLSFAASLDPAESDLTRLKADELRAFFGDDAVKGGGTGPESRAPMWTWLIVMAVMAFFFEGLLLKR